MFISPSKPSKPISYNEDFVFVNFKTTTVPWKTGQYKDARAHFQRLPHEVLVRIFEKYVLDIEYTISRLGTEYPDIKIIANREIAPVPRATTPVETAKTLRQQNKALKQERAAAQQTG
ncbi:hypothetical protein HK097_010435 [Rhizophlyctis rosea]|uniref:Uncharacterized protein n=1 Tax=Rhizophlyctis rosea TaxID=64517 RepID=A0AAD5S7K6_9FUNG|nr:hypothetical protein HK097_010435 [Rhizophlyctis rosea]